jgi:hypothetical protein
MGVVGGIGIGLATVLFFFGLTASADAPVSGRRTLECNVLYYFTVVAIGFSIVLNALALRWVSEQTAKYGLLGILLLLLMPLFIDAWKFRRRTPSQESDALRRWEVYEQTGILPEAVHSGSDCS